MDVITFICKFISLCSTKNLFFELLFHTTFWNNPIQNASLMKHPNAEDLKTLDLVSFYHRWSISTSTFPTIRFVLVIPDPLLIKMKIHILNLERWNLDTLILLINDALQLMSPWPKCNQVKDHVPNNQMQSTNSYELLSIQLIITC